MNDQSKANTTAPTFAIVESDLEAAWTKVQDGLERENEGRELWVEGTLDLVSVLHDARQRLGSDQAFGKWLTENGYGERITRHDRAALLNMALHPELMREVLEQTHRRSWRHIWEEEFQPQLPDVGQPPNPTSHAGGPITDGKGSKSCSHHPTTQADSHKEHGQRRAGSMAPGH